MKKAKLHPLFWMTWKTLLRRKGSTLITIAAMLMASVADIVLYGLQERQEKALAEMVVNTEIRCTVTNCRGSGVDDLNVFSAFTDMVVGFRHSVGCYLDDYVKDVHALAIEALTEPAGVELRRIYSQDSDLDLQKISNGSLSFYEGWGAENLKGNEQICLITEDLRQQVWTDEQGVEYLNITRENGTEIALRVVGTAKGQMKQRVYCPFYADLSKGISETVLLTSCSFTIRDNTALEESKQALYAYFCQPSPAGVNSPLIAGLLISDEIYLQSMEEFQSNLALIRILQPILIAITGCVGFLSAYLTKRKRKKELAVMRCMGVKRKGVFCLLLSEQAALTLCGYALAAVIGTALHETFSSGLLQMLGVLLAVALLGAAAAALQISGVSVMKLMKVEE